MPSSSWLRRHAGRRSETGELSLYTPLDDARDIAWQISTDEDIYKKTYTAKRSLSLRIITLRDESWEYGDKIWPSKSSYQKDFVSIVSESCRFHGYREMDHIELETIEDLSHVCSESEIKNELIFIMTSSLSKEEISEIKHISHLSDVVVLHTFHPRELSHEWGLYEWKIIWSKYHKKLEYTLESIKNTIISLWWSYINIHTWEDITLVLNTFFKQRYLYG